MRAAVATARGLEVTEVARPEPGAGQVLARPLLAGVCGSDLHAVEQLELLGDEQARVVLGHEFCAEVVEHGPGADAAPPPGTRVVSMPYAEGPEGPELLGLSPTLPGAFAESMVLDASLLLPVPDQLSDEAAALTEPLAVGLHAVARAGPTARDAALVVGCGPIGLAVIAALVTDGHGPVVASDLSAARRAAAERVGAHVVVDPATASPYERLAEVAAAERPPSPRLSVGEPARTVVAFECVGRPGMLSEVVAGCPRHTDVVVVGVCPQPDTLEPLTAIEREASVAYVFGYRPEEYAAALDRLAAGGIDADAMVSRVVDLEDLPAAVGPLHRGEEVKVLVRPGANR